MSQDPLDSSRSHAEKAIARREAAAEEMRQRLEQGHAIFETLKRECRENGLSWLAECHGWPGDFEPRDAIEEFLFKQTFVLAEQFAWAKRVRNSARVTYIKEQHTRDEQEAAKLGKQLFFDPRGPAGIFSPPRFSRSEPDSQQIANELTSELARLVEKLESTAAGCQWLLERWGELRANLEPGNSRGPYDNFRTVRLMGNQSLDALENPEVAKVFLASHALDERYGDAFTELRSELRVDEIKDRLWRMRRSAPWLFNSCTAAQGRERLVGIIERAQARLHAKADELRRRAEADVNQAAVGLAFDLSPRGVSLSRAEAGYAKEASRQIAWLRKQRRSTRTRAATLPSRHIAPK